MGIKLFNFDLINTTNDDSRKNMVFIDEHSYSHFMWGFIFYVVLTVLFKFSFYKSLIITIVIHAIYEIKDLFCGYVLRKKKNIELCSDNSWFNTIGDIIVNTLGFFFAFFTSKYTNNFNLSILSLLSIYPSILINETWKKKMTKI
jgi:hypothetical protein